MRVRLIAIAVPFLVAACGGGGGTEPNNTQTLESITATPSTLNISAGSTGSLTVSGIDVNGQPVTGLTNVTLTSQNTAIAEVSGTDVLGISAGSTSITVSARKGSVTKQTTVTANVTGTLPLSANVIASVTNVFSPGTVVVARTGTVTWSFGAVAHNVTFASIAGAPQSIPETSNADVSKTFGTNGNFSYQCTIHAGMSGVVLVR